MGENLYSSICHLNGDNERFGHPPQRIFAMNSNGFFLQQDGTWGHNSDRIWQIRDEFRAQKVSFLGPGGEGVFFNDTYESSEQAKLLVRAFSYPAFTEVVNASRQVDEDQAVRLSYLFGGIVRHLMSQERHDEIPRAIEFAANMTLLGDHKSAEAIASAMAMYIISGGSLERDHAFSERIAQMAEAISNDPVSPTNTRDLGLSQVLRLRAYTKEGEQPEPDIAELRKTLNGFPTVGAEFHLPVELARKDPTLWKRIALLNMSQYQRDSAIQLSRIDRDVIEIRMNPSDFPTTVATWEYMKRLIPEIDKEEASTAYFWLTLNRPDKNFSWHEDEELLKKLRAIGLLCYAGMHENIPRAKKSGEIKFGEVYLGQTVRLEEDGYSYEGTWGGNRGDFGQVSMYVGFAQNFRDLAHWLPLALANPNVIPQTVDDGTSEKKTLLEDIQELSNALATTPRERRLFFIRFQNNINRDARLRNAYQTGIQIIQRLKA